jgi:hypothetical protein
MIGDDNAVDVPLPPVTGLSDLVSGWVKLLAPLSAGSSRLKVMTACWEPSHRAA